MTWQNASNAEPPLGIDEPHLPVRGKPILVSAIYFADGTRATALSPLGPWVDRRSFGNGVNVAALLQALAEPGGIRASRVVRDQVRDRLDQRSWKAVSHSTGDQRFDSRLLQADTRHRCHA